MNSSNYSQEVENLKNEALDFKYREETEIPTIMDKIRSSKKKLDDLLDNTEQGWENQDRQQEYQASQTYNESSQPW